VEMKKNEIDEVIAFHNKYLGKREFINHDELEDRLDSKRGIFLVAKDEKENIVGIKLGYVEGPLCIGRGIAVDKKYRRMGIGKSLIEEFDNRLKELGTVRQYIFASDTKEGIPFHISFGYKRILLAQFKEKDLGKKIKPKGYNISKMNLMKDLNCYQIFLNPKGNKVVDFEEFNKLKDLYPGIEIVLFFVKSV